MSTAINIIDLDFGYVAEQKILQDVSFEIKKGEFLGIIGPNGGGKTTLLKLIAGLLIPTKGQITIFEKSPKEGRKYLGYVSQVLSKKKSFPISVRELVLLGAVSKTSWLGSFPKEILERADYLLEEMGLSTMRDAAFGALSEGQAQRALIAQALLCDPEILLLDEPTASVDKIAEQKIFAILEELKGKKTIIMISHDLNTIVKKVDRIACVQNSVSLHLTKDICEHFALGLYHTPILSEESHARDFFKHS